MSHWGMLTVAQGRSGEERLPWEGKLKRLPKPPPSFLLGFFAAFSTVGLAAQSQVWPPVFFLPQLLFLKQVSLCSQG